MLRIGKGHPGDAGCDLDWLCLREIEVRCKLFDVVRREDGVALLAAVRRDDNLHGGAAFVLEHNRLAGGRACCNADQWSGGLWQKHRASLSPSAEKAALPDRDIDQAASPSRILTTRCTRLTKNRNYVHCRRLLQDRIIGADTARIEDGLAHDHSRCCSARDGGPPISISWMPNCNPNFVLHATVGVRQDCVSFSASRSFSRSAVSTSAASS